MKNNKSIISKVSLFIVAIALVFIASYVSADYSDPANTPPTCPAGSPGCDTPVNVGTVGQVKNGGLSVNAFAAYMNSWFEQNVSVKGTIGGTTGTPAAPVAAPLTVATDLKVSPLAGTGDRVVCSDSTGTLNNCTSIANASGPLTVSISGYCGSGMSAPAVPSSLSYYKIGDAVHVYGIIRFNISTNKNCLSAQINGMPKAFPATGSPVINERAATYKFYQSSSWQSRSGSMDFNNSGGANVLAFYQYNAGVFNDPLTVPADGEWLAFVDFTY